MIDDNELLRLLTALAARAVNGLVAHQVLELDNLPQSIVDKPPLGLDEFLALLSGRVEEARVDLAVA